MNRSKEIVRTGYIGIATNLCVSTTKALIGLAAGSTAIVLDAVNNVSDALSSVITIVGVKLAGRPADDEHPFGYGRIEYFTAVIIAAMILAAGAISLIESVKGIIEPTDQEYSYTGLIILGITVVTKYGLGIYTQHKGKQLKSDALIGSGKDSIFDSVISTSTLLSAGIFIFTGISLDSWFAAAISLLLIKAGIETLLSPIDDMLGIRADAELTSNIKKSIKENIPDIRGVYDVVLHNYGPNRNFGALHVEVEDCISAAQLHHITRLIQRLIWKEFGIFFTVGFYAHHAEGTHEAEVEKEIRKYVLSHNGVLNMHGFYISDEEKMISFDIVYSFKLHTPMSLRNEIAQKLIKDFPGYDINIGMDRNYSE